MKPSHVGAVAAACAVLLPSAADAFSPYLVVPPPAVAEASPAYRYANMTDAEALGELARRRIPYLLARAPGVRAPIRLAGPLHGVYVHGDLPPAKSLASPNEILDARLALALDDFCALLATHGVYELVHFRMYQGKGASGAPGTRHPAGLAIDVGRLHKRDGTWLTVASDYHGQVGARTCGPGATWPATPAARELRALVCGSSDRGTFTYVLTPNYDAHHVDHFHMEIKPGVRWFLYN